MRPHIRTYLYAQSLRDTTTQFGVGPEEVAKLAHDDLLAERAVDPLHIAYDVTVLVRCSSFITSRNRVPD